MIPQMIVKMVVPKVLDMVIRQFKMDKVMEYVFDRNELDHKMREVEKRLNKLESKSHKPIDYKKEIDKLKKEIKKGKK